jgi:tetratricopeptide (TPR) repeat protein
LLHDLTPEGAGLERNHHKNNLKGNRTVKKGKENQPQVVANFSLNFNLDGRPSLSVGSGQPPAFEFNLFAVALETFKADFKDKFRQARLQYPDVEPEEVIDELFEIHQQDAEYETQQALAEGNPQKAKILQSLLQAASEAAEELVKTEVIVPLKRKVQTQSSDVDAHIRLGKAYYTIEQHTKAIESFKQAVRVNPNASEAYFNLGLVHNSLGNHTEAIESFKQMVHIDTNSAQAHTALGGAYLHKKHFQEAVKSLREAIRIEPGLPHAHYLLGLVHVQLGDKTSARDEHRSLLKLDPSMAEDLMDNIRQG